MIHNLRAYTSLAATTEVTYNFNCNTLNGLMMHNSTKNDELKLSVRVGRYQLISDVTLAGLNAILAPRIKNQDDAQFLIPFGSLNTSNQTITITVHNTGSTAKTVGLQVVYDNGKASTTKPICYKSYTVGEFSGQNVVSCAFYSGGTGSLISSTANITFTHNGVTESIDAQCYEDLWISTSLNTGQTSAGAGRAALILTGKPGTLNLSGPYASGDEYVIAYV
jgi:hypothetical protein